MIGSAKPKDPVKTNQKTDAVYTVYTRLKEHQKAVSTLNRGKSALAEHVCDTKHEIAWKTLK